MFYTSKRFIISDLQCIENESKVEECHIADVNNSNDDVNNSTVLLLNTLSDSNFNIKQVSIVSNSKVSIISS